MKRIIYSLFLALIVLVGCKKAEFNLFDTSNIYVQFVNDEASLTFKSYSGLTSIAYPFEISIHGVELTEDREIKISADTSSTAIEGVHFSFEDKYIMEAGTLSSTIFVNLHLTEDMDTVSYDLVLNIEDAPNALRGELIQTKITYNNFLEQPAWWVNSASNIIYTNYLGTYTSLKYEYFMSVTGVIDMEDWTYAEAYAVTKQFQDWLDEQAAAGNTIYELDGSEMTTAL